MIKGILFDMDGVLADTEYFYQQRREKFLEEKQYVRKEKTNFVGSNEKAIWEALVPDNEQLRQSMMLEYREYQKLYPEPYEDLIDPQVKPLFEQLKSRGILIGIASSSDRESIQKMMQAADIIELVDYIISGTECKNHKPDPEIYITALKDLQLDKKEAFAVEDSPIGILAAKNAGLKVYALKPRHGEPLDQKNATKVMEQLKDVLLFLD